MSKYFKIFLSSFAILVFYTESLNSATVGRATVYKVTMETMQLCEDSACANYTTTCNTSKVVDIAAVDPGAEVANWCSLNGLPIGTTFTHLRVRLNRAFTLKGGIIDRNGSTDCYTGSTVAGNKTTLAFGSESADFTGETLVEQEIWIYDGRGGSGGNYIKSSTGNVDSWWSEYTHADRPSGSTSWCVGTIAGTHNTAQGVCADTNTKSATWDDAATADSLQIIYPLQEPYTVGPASPKLTLTFDTSKGIQAEWFGGARCEMAVGQVKFTANISE